MSGTEGAVANRPRPITAQRRRCIGIAVLLARQAGVKWKVLESVYQRERTQLWRLAREATRLMQQNSPLMQHQAPGPGEAAVETMATSETERDEVPMGGGGYSAPAPAAPPPAPTLSDPAVSNAARAEQMAAARARGRAATILTGGLGLMTPAPTQQKTLLGQ